VLSYEPTYTTPAATAGEDWTGQPVANDHSSAPVAALSAYSLPSSEPA
jgi:hypothetical protein